MYIIFGCIFSLQRDLYTSTNYVYIMKFVFAGDDIRGEWCGWKMNGGD